MVDGYYKVSGELANVTNWNGTQAGAAGAIVSTAEDMARFAKGLFGGELFKDDATLEEMIALRELGFLEGGGVMAGYGLGLISFATPGYRAIGHAGQTPGFQSIWFRVPEAEHDRRAADQFRQLPGRPLARDTHPGHIRPGGSERRIQAAILRQLRSALPAPRTGVRRRTRVATSAPLPMPWPG